MELKKTNPEIHRDPRPLALLDEVLGGLSRQPKRLPTKLFYDERGSQLFDQITQLPEYYPTRTETGILNEYAGEMADRIGPRCCLVELGSGSSTKTRILLDQLHDVACYVPVDISQEYLETAARALSDDYPDVSVAPLCADFTKSISLPGEADSGDRVAVFFPGSTIGNFLPGEAVQLLRRVRDLIGEEGCLILGADTCQDDALLHHAYNDSAGVTAEFNLNALHVLNRELGADFDPEKFEHRAVFNPGLRRVEMRLISGEDQQIQINGDKISIAEGEPLVTEYSHKFLPADLERMAGEAGLHIDHVWRDEDRIYGVHFLTPMDESKA